MVVASIDIMQGKVVQLRQGQDKMLERDDPFALADEFDKYGDIAVIDLDAAMGKGDNAELVKAIVKRAECRVGGGIRSVPRAQELIALGVRKVIIGSQAFENNHINHAFLQELAAAIGRQHIIVAVDARHGEIVTRGWKHQTAIPLLEAVRQLEPYCIEFLFTCVEREGTMTGTDLNLVKQLTQTTSNKITAAGGVATLDEVKALAALGVDVQLGMALYTGKISLTDAFIESLRWNAAETLPTIVQAETGQVLMLAYSNKTSLKVTFETGRMAYCAPTSEAEDIAGTAAQQFIRMRADCGRDALLATVKPVGNICHLGTSSCFGDRRPE